MYNYASSFHVVFWIHDQKYTFIQQECIILSKRDSTIFFEMFYSEIATKSIIAFIIDNNKKWFLRTKSAY